MADPAASSLMVAIECRIKPTSATADDASTSESP
jgi:hypothetical protein